MSTNSVLWTEGEWCCQLLTGPAGSSRLVVYHIDKPVTAEATVEGLMAKYRAEILRQRVLRGDLRAN